MAKKKKRLDPSPRPQITQFFLRMAVDLDDGRCVVMDIALDPLKVALDARGPEAALAEATRKLHEAVQFSINAEYGAVQ